MDRANEKSDNCLVVGRRRRRDDGGGLLDGSVRNRCGAKHKLNLKDESKRLLDRRLQPGY
jgi:hypothetical protein